MASYNRKQTYDPNVLAALDMLPKIMKNDENKEVSIRLSARDESGKQHIAVSTHGLQVRDIESLPKILKKPYFKCKDPHNKNYKNYYGERKGQHDSCSKNKGKLLKIVTNVRLDGSEEIVTVFPTNSIKN